MFLYLLYFLFLKNIYAILLQPGLELHYNITFLGAKVATQKTIVENIESISNRKYFKVYTLVEIVPSLKSIYYLRDEVYTLLDAETFLPFKIYTIVNEGKWKNKVYITIDQENKWLDYKDKKIEKRFKFEGDLLSLDSALFYFKNKKIFPGSEIKVSISKKRKIESLTAWVEKIEKIKVPAFENERFSYIIQVSNKKVILYLDKVEKIPLKIKTELIPIADKGILTITHLLYKYIK